MERIDRPGRRRDTDASRAARPFPAASAVIGLALAGTLLGCASVPVSAGSHHQPPSAATSPASHTARTASAARAPAIGKPYPFKLYIHCGAPTVTFAGRAWKPVPPVPNYPGPREVNGTATYTGYVVGTMTLVNLRTLRFTADPGAVAAPFSVLYEQSATRITVPVCS
jgi:hypothetical protein